MGRAVTLPDSSFIGSQLFYSLNHPALLVNDELLVVACSQSLSDMVPQLQAGATFRFPVAAFIDDDKCLNYDLGADIEEVFKTSAPITRDCCYCNSFGQTKYIQLTLMPWRESDHFQCSTIIVLASDVTSSFRQKMHYAEVENELSILYRHISHDLAGPIASTNALLQLMHDDVVENVFEDIPNFVVEAQNQLIRIKSLINNLSSLSRTDNAETHITQFDVAKLINEASDDLMLVDRKVFIDSKVDANIETLVSDRFRVLEILKQLFSNAYKFHDPDKPEIKISVLFFKHEECFEIRVQDVGYGINPLQVADIFDLFVRGDTFGTYGSGLGLFIVKKHAEKLGGNVSVSNYKNPTEISIILPN